MRIRDWLRAAADRLHEVIVMPGSKGAQQEAARHVEAAQRVAERTGHRAEAVAARARRFMEDVYAAEGVVEGGRGQSAPGVGK